MKKRAKDKDFESYLFEKYPALFPKDENGQLLPQHQRCWNDCPLGWEGIVESLFGCIDDYVSNISWYEPNPKHKIRLMFKELYWKYINPFMLKFLNVRPIPFQEQHKQVKYSLKQKCNKFINRLYGKIVGVNDLYVETKPPSVIIDQYKEKFGMLRIYYSGGDREVGGMIRYAEYLSSRTCQKTGKEGVMCKRGSWYATLSQTEAKKNNFKIIV